MTFYRQAKQDSWLEKNVFCGFKNGVFIDIGAHDGVKMNNTLYFEKTNGWTGVNVEPIREVYDKLLANRPKCINLNCAVSDKNGTAKFIMNRGYTELISGLESDYDPRHLERLKKELAQQGGSSDVIVVETKRVDTICNENNITHIHYLSIDVEGAEFSVIKSIDFEKVFIDVIGFENNYDDTSVPIVEYLKSKGYMFIHNDLDIFMIHQGSQFNHFSVNIKPRPRRFVWNVPRG